MGRGFSAFAAKAVAQAHRSSTRALYDTKWDSFVSYCTSQGVDPAASTPQIVSDFVLHLRRSRSLRGGTIATYVSAINTVLAATSGVRVGSAPEVSAILRGFRLEDQRKKFRPPAWDLNVVLRFLSSPAFEPLADAAILRLTQKTVFLLSMATAARISEVHALDVTQVTYDRGSHAAVHIGVMWDFIAKNQRPGQPDRVFHLRPLSSILGPDDVEDLSLCPVRSLRRYIQVTSAYRRQRKRLLLPLQSASSRSVSKTSVAYWIRSCVLDAYKAAGLPPPKADNPHELRALASTMALHSNCSVVDIVQGCFWATDSTFASHYLRDVSVEDVRGLPSFGPLVLAQQLTHPRPRPRCCS